MSDTGTKGRNGWMMITLLACGAAGLLSVNGCVPFGCGGVNDGCIQADGGLGPCEDVPAVDAGHRDAGSEDLPTDGGAIT